MFAGHLGAGLMLKRVDPTVGLGWLLGAALLPDILLWCGVLAGVETVSVPEPLRSMADLRYDFPYSHGLVAGVGWSIAMAGLMAFCRRGWGRPGWRAPLTVAAAVLSHLALDGLVHRPELPLVGRQSPRWGLDLWSNLPLAWSVEALVVGVGVWVFLGARPLPPRRRRVLVAVMTVVTVLTIGGQASHSPPPGMAVMASTSLLMIGLLIGFGWWVDRGKADAEERR